MSTETKVKLLIERPKKTVKKNLTIVLVRRKPEEGSLNPKIKEGRDRDMWTCMHRHTTGSTVEISSFQV